jgi:anti-sigma factor RsiW
MGDCCRIRDLIGSYVYGELDAAERAIVDAHLRQCQRCRDEFAETRKLIRAIPSGLLEAPPQAEERVLRAVQDRLTSRARRPQLQLRGRWVLVGAAAVAMGVLIAFQLPFEQDTKPGDHPGESSSFPTALTAQGPGADPHVNRPQETHPPAPTAASLSPRMDEAQTTPKMTPDQAPRGPVRVGRPQTVALLAPRPVGVDDVTTTLEAVERD